MNRILLYAACVFSLGGCAMNSNEIEKNVSIEKEVNNTEDMFYHAMIGSLMEYNSQNNNAINHYESILINGYNKDVVDKLLPLYEYKKDYVGLFKLLDELNEEQILKNHKKYAFSYYVLKEKHKDAVDLALDKLNITNNNNYNIIIEKRISNYYSFVTDLKIIDVISDNHSSDFFSELKKNDESAYLTLYTNYLNGGELSDFDHKNKNLNKKDEAIFLILNYYKLPTLEILKDMDENGFQIKLLEDMILRHYKQLLKEKDYKEMKELSEYLIKDKKIESSDYEVFEYLAYLFLFENKNALFKLEKIKDEISSDFYLYGKSILNYRLGYKRAAKKYMRDVKDLELIAGSLSLYLDIMDDYTLLEKNLTEAELMNFKLSYLMNKKDIKNANILKDEIVLYIKDNNVDNIYIDMNLLFLEFLNDEKSGIEKARMIFEENDDESSTNFYAYLLALSNTNIEHGLNILEIYMNENTDPSVVDTYGWLLYKNGNLEEALNLYKMYKMIYSQDTIVQHHLYKINLKLGNNKDAEFHKKASHQLLNK